jgi:hypothetical protein
MKERFRLMFDHTLGKQHVWHHNQIQSTLASKQFCIEISGNAIRITQHLLLNLPSISKQKFT